MKTDLQKARGFTLTENLMAMTLVVAVAVPLTAMLGMAASSRTGGDQRKASAFIARQIAVELAHSTAELGVPASQWYPLIAVRPPAIQGGDWPYLTDFPPDLSGHSVYLAYDNSLRPAGEISASAYEGGVRPPPGPGYVGPDPQMAVRIAFEQVPLSHGPAQTLRATVTVGSPALAALKSRHTESFTTLIHLPGAASQP